MFKYTLHRDYETKSIVDLKKCGVHVYAAHASTSAWCCAYGVNDEPAKLWTPDQPVPGEFKEAAESPEWEAVAHNNAFERTIENVTLKRLHNWPTIPLERQRCTMAQALSMSLPASLANAAAATGIEAQKDMGGHDLMLRMSKPRRPRKGELPNGIYYFDDEERRQRLYAYCLQDLAVERGLDKRLLRLRPSEQRLWVLDAVINDRGVHVDVPLCRAALKVVETATGWLNDEMREITGGAVSAISNVGQLSAWCRERGWPMASLDKEALDDALIRLHPNCTPDLMDVRRALEIRREGAKASVRKIDALLAGRSADGRARGLLQYHAAGPGRWGGRRFQPHNIKRPESPDEVDAAIDLVATGSADAVGMVFGEPLAVVGDCLRGMVKAPEGRKIFAADLKNIEGRVTSWVSGEEWKLQAFRDFDAGTGHDLYKLAYARSFYVAPEAVDKDQRQIGKVMELALGFQGGVGAFQKMSGNYGVKVSDARADELKVAWREAHPNTVQTWYDLENAAQWAVRNRGKTVDCGPVRFRVAGSFLFLRLPSGRSIAYPYPCIKDKLMPWGDMRPQVSFKGIDTFTRKWTDCFAYGGLWMQNIAEGISRDVLVEGMNRLIDAGYETLDPADQGIILTVHDEVVAEVAQDFGSLDEFKTLMTGTPAWAEGLPVAADAFEARRYRK